MGLLIDIGNTNTHVGTCDLKRGVRKRCDFPTKLWFSGQIDEKLSEFGEYIGNEGIALCSVVPEATAMAVSSLDRNFKFIPWILTCKNVPICFSKYPDPSSLGADRIANAVAAARVYHPPAIVVSCGTAVTIDCVDKNYCFRGGVILPGVSMFTQYLHEKTALLPEVQFEKYSRFYGKDKKTAILAGINKGFPGMIGTMIDGMFAQLRLENAIVVATGAYARQIEKEVGVIDVVDPELTLWGLYISWKQSI
ncbi:MAG: type III pantothenate kinase [Verrucomicrobiae bacterium]|nr:type III pantothenate kinase [Verrucomicrobiae bacterium]